MVLSQLDKLSQRGVQEVVPHLYQFSIRGVNLMLIAEEELTLIDTGLIGSSVPIVKYLHRLGRSVKEISLIIITHNHLDHIGGLAELKKLTRAKVAVHKADINEAEGQLPYPRVIEKTLRIPPFSALRSVFLIDSSEVDIQLVGGEVLKPLGGLQVVHTPGHTPGSISLFSPQNRLLMVGDALDKRRQDVLLPHKLVSTDLRQAVASVGKMAQLEVDILCFGHGRPLVGDIGTKLQALMAKSQG